MLRTSPSVRVQQLEQALHYTLWRALGCWEEDVVPRSR